MNYNGPKIRLSRKLNVNLTSKAHKYTSKKSYPPGAHGNSKRRMKQSDYGKQLLEKQRLRLQYSISEKQMLNNYKSAAKMTGNTAEIIVQLLETRLDAVVFRAGLAASIWAARQYVGHGHILVNGRRVNIPSYRVKVNDVVSVKEKSRKLDCFQDAIRSSAPPNYLEVSKADFSTTLLGIPDRQDVPLECEVPLVIEYYSR